MHHGITGCIQDQRGDEQSDKVQPGGYQRASEGGNRSDQKKFSIVFVFKIISLEASFFCSLLLIKNL